MTLNQDSTFFQGEDIKKIPTKPGIYAWYYRPIGRSVVSTGQLKKTLASLVPYPEKVRTEIKNRYNIRYIGDADLAPYYGANKISCEDKIDEAVGFCPKFIGKFVKDFMIPAFTSPLYIGITNDLYKRVYNQHYKELTDLWLADSHVSKFMASSKPEKIQELLDFLGLSHNFATEARFRGFAPRDLGVFVCPTEQIALTEEEIDDEKNRYAIEDLLQIISDPICGRM